MNNDNMKIVLLAFNGECDSIISKVKFNNVERIEDRIKKTANKINKLNERNKISIKQKYISLKIEELYLAYEYEQKKQEEKEAIRRIREEEREAQKLAKELEEARKDIDKEKNHYSNALEKAKVQLIEAGDTVKTLPRRCQNKNGSGFTMKVDIVSYKRLWRASIPSQSISVVGEISTDLNKFYSELQKCSQNVVKEKTNV